MVQGPNLNALITKMNKALKIVSDWAEEMGLKISTEKTVAMVFTRQRRKGTDHLRKSRDFPGFRDLEFYS